MNPEAVKVRREFETREEVLDELAEHLQTAIQLEHSTIPFYFYMYWSLALHPDFDSAPERIRHTAGDIHAVILEEMLHFGLVSNILRAVGGTPGIKGEYTPVYPGPLPGHSKKHQFDVHLQKCDLRSVITAMRIERPAKPGQRMVNDEYTTIGQFYAHLVDLIEHPLLTDEDFQHGGQMLRWGGKAGIPLYSHMPVKGDMHAFWITINSKDDAIKALVEITEQGEGFGDTLFEGKDTHDLSHFATFLETYMAMGGKIAGNNTFEEVHSDEIMQAVHRKEFDHDMYNEFQKYVLPLVRDPSLKKDNYTPEGLAANEAFNHTYSRMLDNMHETFSSSSPRTMEFPRMYGLQEAAKKVIQHGLKKGPNLCGPSFEYIPEETAV